MKTHDSSLTPEQFIASRGKWGMCLGLERIRALLEKLDNPQNKLKFVHVAGSNGKGSVCRMLEGVLTQAGCRPGVYTSPALEHFNERIRVAGTPISETTLTRLFSRVRAACTALEAESGLSPTGFEIETAIALLYFLESGCRLCVMEVGLGGRLDATNIIPPPEVCVITPISLEHTQYLGDTLAQIAAEKGAVIKPDASVVLGPQEPEALKTLTDAAKTNGAREICEVRPEEIRVLDSGVAGQRLYYAPLGTFSLGLAGSYQPANCLTALKTVEALRRRGYSISDQAVRTALKEATFPGRFEMLCKAPYVLIDGAHNPDGIRRFAESVRAVFKDKKITLFFGMLAEKDVERALDTLLPLADSVALLTPDSPGALSAEAMYARVRAHADIPARVFEDYESAVRAIDFKDSTRVYACVGSLYMIGKLRPILKKVIAEQKPVWT